MSNCKAASGWFIVNADKTTVKQNQNYLGVYGRDLNSGTCNFYRFFFFCGGRRRRLGIVPHCKAAYVNGRLQTLMCHLYNTSTFISGRCWIVPFAKQQLHGWL